MESSQQIATDGVAWVPPELLGRWPGEYRLVEIDKATGEQTPSGALVVWVDDAPHDQHDGSGHFEAYDGDPANYQPTTAKA